MQKIRCCPQQLAEVHPGNAQNSIKPVPFNTPETVAVHTDFKWPMPGSMAARRFIHRQRLLAVRPRRRLSTWISTSPEYPWPRQTSRHD